MNSSVAKLVTSLEEIKQAISTHAARGAEKIRLHGVIAGRIRVFMHTNKYRKTTQFYGVECGSLRPYTNDTRQIINEAMQLTDIVFRPGIEYGKCGIILEVVSQSLAEFKKSCNGQDLDSSQAVKLLRRC